MLSWRGMHALIVSALLAISPAHASQRVELREATHELAVARAEWDAAVAGGHPVSAGKWARRHFAAMQKVNTARQRLASAAK
jgi:hypothetical protein